MENTIFNSKDETIGYYDDIYKGYKELMNNALKSDNIEELEDLTDQIKDLEDWKDYPALIVVSENNGMGVTFSPYKPENDK